LYAEQPLNIILLAFSRAALCPQRVHGKDIMAKQTHIQHWGYKRRPGPARPGLPYHRTFYFLVIVVMFERKIFRRIYGPKYENGEWKSRTNRELEEMSKGENIVKWIKG